MLDPKILTQAIMHSRDGITISDPNQPDNPLIFVNKAFEEMTGYSREDIINRNCRYLQGDQRTQRSIKVIKEAIDNAKSCLVTLKNYRKDGSLFWNELSISPVFDEQGKLMNFIGIQKDVTSRVERDQFLFKERKYLYEKKAKLEELVIHDGLTGIYNRQYFENQLNESWQFLTNNQCTITLMMIDIDYFKLYNDTYGHIAGDAALKQVASVLNNSMRRDTDFIARYGGEEFVVLALDLTKQQAIERGNLLCANIRNLNIPHKSSPIGRVTISCGIAHADSINDCNPNLLIQNADKALYESKSSGRNQATLTQI